MSSLEERVKNDIGEGVNPLYVQTLLDKSDREILIWLSQDLANIQNVVTESQAYVENQLRRRTLQLGCKILIGRLRTALFIVDELQTRLKSVEPVDS